MPTANDELFTPYQEQIIDGLLRNQESMLNILETHKKIIESQNKTISLLMEKMENINKSLVFSTN